MEQVSAHDGSLNPVRKDISDLQEIRRRDKEKIKELEQRLSVLEDFLHKAKMNGRMYLRPDSLESNP